jgi:hypothetical protein
MLTPETLHEALERASAQQPFVPDYEQAVQRSDRMRVRRLGASALATIAAVASIALGLVLTVGRDSGHSGFTVRPAPMASSPGPSSATVYPSLDGVTVTWLPKGFEPEPASTRVASDVSIAMQDFRGDATTAASHRLSLKVTRGPAARPDTYVTGVGTTIFPVTVQGHPGQLVTAAATGSTEIPAPLYVLQWTEQPGLVLSVAGSFGASLSDVQHMAAGLVAHHATAATVEDEAEVRAAFEQAYTGGTSDATILGAIEDGQELAPTLTDLRRVAPQTVTSARVTIGSVQFVDANHATVTVALSYLYGGAPSNMTGSQNAIRVNGKWKVTQKSYCGVIDLAGVTCPQG